MHRYCWVAFLALLPSTASAADEAIARPIAALKAVDREGKNNDTVGLAWSSLVSQGGAALIPALEAIDDSNPTAANWLLTAVGAIAEAETKANRKLPADKLESFVKNTKQAGSARVFAYELLTAANKGTATKLLPGFLNDPSAELRRSAVAAELAAINASAKPSVKVELETLLTAARDQDQVEAIAKKLEVDYKVKVNLAEHFAFITHWNVVGPFESAQGKALTLKHSPEEKVDVGETLKGKKGAEVKWKPVVSRDKYATVDFNKVIGKHYDAAAYATATIYSAKATPAEIRIGCPNAVQVYLNGKKLFEREEYHHGDAMDYHVGKGQLAAGSNVLVVKVCQNNQKESWAQRWQFQGRVCDATGAPIPGVTQTIRYQDILENIKLGTVPPLSEEKK